MVATSGISSNPPSKKSWPESLISEGEMSNRIHTFNWANTPLGSIEYWSKSLQLIVKTALASSFPMYIQWGEDYIQIYNDNFIPLAGHNHPNMLGKPFRETWAEIWEPIVKPIFTRVRETGKPVLIEDQHFPVR
jgi:hypothetical protein